MQSQYNMRSPAVKRLMKEAQELRDPTELFYAQPLDDNLFEWHFTIRGPGDTEFDGGIFHGRIVLPPDYPMKPPSIIILTPNGRFEVNKKICLSISGHHPESWQPSWSIRTTLLAIIGFMPTHGAGAIGSLDYTPDERKILSKKSLNWKCAVCGNVGEILKPLTEASKETSQEAKALASQINFQGEKGDKSNNGKVSSPTPAAPVSSPPNSSSSPSVTNSSSQGATAANTTSASAASLPQMMFPSTMNPGGIPTMFPQMPPFLPPMAGQFPFPYRFPYPPVNSDSNSMPCNLMMPPFPNPFMPPMFPAGFTFPPAGNPENQTSSNNMPPSFPFPFMPAPPTVPVSSNPTSVASSNSVTTTSTQATHSVNKSPSTSSSTKTSTSPSTSSTSSTTPSTSTSKDQARNDGGASTSGASKLSRDPSTASARDKNTLFSTSSPPSSSSDASKTAKTNSEENNKPSETANSAAETSTTTESGLRQRATAGSGDASVTTANTAATQPTATPVSERAGQSRSTPSFVLMVILGAVILLLCLRRLYISADNFPYPDYQQ